MPATVSSARTPSAFPRRVTSLVWLTSWIVLSLACGQQKAAATSITFQFTGIVSTVDAPLAGTFSVGQSFSGSYTFDSNLIDTFPADPTVGRYTPVVYSFNVGSYHGSGANGMIQVQTSPVQEYLFDAQPFVASPVNGFPPSQFHLDLFGSSGMPIANDSLPLTPPKLSDFQNNFFLVRFEDASQNRSYDVRGPITSLTVPEPASSLALLFPALASLARLRRRVLVLATGVPHDLHADELTRMLLTVSLQTGP
jgi:hypothetical protein